MPPRREAGAKKETKQKKKKDPNAPKRAMSSYMFFANDNRDSVRAENPGIAFGEIGKILGTKWKAMSEAKKKPYEDQAAADKARYESEKAAYLKKKESEFHEE